MKRYLENRAIRKVAFMCCHYVLEDEKRYICDLDFVDNLFSDILNEKQFWYPEIFQLICFKIPEKLKQVGFKLQLFVMFASKIFTKILN